MLRAPRTPSGPVIRNAGQRLSLEQTRTGRMKAIAITPCPFRLIHEKANGRRSRATKHQRSSLRLDILHEEIIQRLASFRIQAERGLTEWVST